MHTLHIPESFWFSLGYGGMMFLILAGIAFIIWASKED